MCLRDVKLAAFTQGEGNQLHFHLTTPLPALNKDCVHCSAVIHNSECALAQKH